MIIRKLAWKLIPWNSGLHACLREWNAKRSYERWMRTGKTGRLPEYYKHLLVRETATKHDFRTFVETGTFLGDMLGAVEHIFDELHSVELSEELYLKACKRFRNEHKIHLYQGDSAEVLPRILEKVNQPALFWLDAHPIPDKPEWKVVPIAGKEIPIVAELKAIEHHPIKGHIVLVDDADLLTGEKGWPRSSDLKCERNTLILVQ